MQFEEDRTFGFVVFGRSPRSPRSLRSLRSRGNPCGVEGDEEVGNGGPDSKIGNIGGGYLLKQRRTVRPQRRWERRLLVPCSCESDKPGCQVVTRICKLDKSGWRGAGDKVEEGGEIVLEIVLDIYPY
jgi:hypothetical protein